MQTDVLEERLEVSVRHVLHDKSNGVAGGTGADQPDDIGVAADLFHQADFTQQLVPM